MTPSERLTLLLSEIRDLAEDARELEHRCGDFAASLESAATCLGRGEEHDIFDAVSDLEDTSGPTDELDERIARALADFAE